MGILRFSQNDKFKTRKTKYMEFEFDDDDFWIEIDDMSGSYLSERAGFIIDRKEARQLANWLQEKLNAN